MNLPCIVERVIFRNPQGFAILAVNLNANSALYNAELEETVEASVTMNKYNNFSATIGMLEPEDDLEHQQVVLVGEFVSNPKYGKQFKAEFYFIDEPKNEDGLRDYLMRLPNIKESRSNAIIAKFGVEETVRILNEEPMKLIEVSGITEKRIAPIKEVWDKDKNLRDLYFWLGAHKITSISKDIGKKIYEKWKDKSLEILTNNPYQLTDIRGIGFLTADAVALRIFGNKLPKKNRTVACIKHVLEDALYSDGNLCIPYALLKGEVVKTMGQSDKANGITSDMSEYQKLVPVCIKENLEIFAPVKDIPEDRPYVYFRVIWNKEKFIAEKLFARKMSNGGGSKSYVECSDQELRDAEEDIARFHGRQIVLDECQKQAIRSAFEHKITVITGGGGTGKSTICRCIYHLASENNLSIRMMSPTGKAAQVLAAKTDYPAATIHRSLRMKPDDDVPREEIQEDIVLIDEVSMVGIDTMYAIFVALQRNPWSHLVFVGDPNQLPSVSPGNFLSDIIQSGCANVVKLDKIHRQDENSYISVVANDIAGGKITRIPDTATDIRWHEITDPENFKDRIQEVVREYLKKKGGVEDLQIIAPMYKGNCGVNLINETIQEMMAVTRGYSERLIQRRLTKLYLGDRVIQTVNDYDKQVFNGDMGIITEIGKKVIDPSKNDKEEEYVVVDFYNNMVLYRSAEIEQLRPAWCITTHKFQGSQSPDIIFIMAREARIMMSKELVYTGITRAEKNVDIYGNDDMFRQAPGVSVVKIRYTNMNKVIKELRENRKILQVMDPPKLVEDKK